MRYKVTLQPISTSDKQKRFVLPDNFYTELARNISNIIHISDKSLQNWLQRFGFQQKTNPFRFYTFSHLDIPKTQKLPIGAELKCNEIYFFISFYPFFEISDFIDKIFKDKIIVFEDFNIRLELIVSKFEKLNPDVLSEKMKFSALSPILVSYKDHTANHYTEYMYPKGEKFRELFAACLIDKYRVLSQFPDTLKGATPRSELDIKLLKSPKACAVSVNPNTRQEIQLLAYLFDFEITGPIELIEIGYHLGFGEENYNGFGFCKKME